MLVKIEEIQEPGLERTEPVDAAVLETALAESGEFVLAHATPLKATFKKVSGQVHVQGAMEATVKAPCKRCLKEQTLDVTVSFSLRMLRQVPEAPPQETGEAGASKGRGKRRAAKKDEESELMAASFELDEIDAEPFDGKTIDLDPIVREQLLLALPVTVLCQEGCKGLCGRCGQDLNERECGHGAEKQVDVRLAKLKDIKLKN